MKRIKLSDEQREKASQILKLFKNDYEKFSKNRTATYEFTKTVGVKVCPYCNINFISTVFSDDEKPKGVLRPDIDHFFCKSEYPELQLCLFNLIPSCSPCNQRLKRDADFMVEPHIHPYFHDFDSIIQFRVRLKESANYFDESNIEIEFVPQASVSKHLVSRAKNNIKTFRLKERYKLHADQAVDLFKKAKYYWKAKKEEINRLLAGKSRNASDLLPAVSLDRVLFPEKDCDINQVSLGKLKKDIIIRYCL
ncbi:MAG: hypothetical protein VZQ47_00510 [Treponema sp.]|nr:hypothetical protein [Treponema sp.]MEE3434024.1 hypothetical protein [Treponema sp.]